MKKIAMTCAVLFAGVCVGCSSTSKVDSACATEACATECATACSGEKSCCGSCGGEAKTECCGTCGGDAHSHDGDAHSHDG